jgi:hypothetical protein
MFPGRLARFTLMGSTDADFTKLQRSACAGSNYVWIMGVPMESAGEFRVDVVEYRLDRVSAGM